MNKTPSLKTLIPFREFSKPVLLQAAFSKQNRCIICKRKKVRMHRIRQHSILYGYSVHNIFLRDGSRCCTRHLDERGLI